MSGHICGSGSGVMARFLHFNHSPSNYYLVFIQVLIPSSTPYAVALMLGSARYTIAPSIVDDMKAIKNDVEIEGLERAYLRDGIAFVRWLAWLEEKFHSGFAITEYEAAYRLTEFRKRQDKFMGLAYENISASGPNAGEYL
jgi:Xaa-Pro aminopeptidase